MCDRELVKVTVLVDRSIAYKDPEPRRYSSDAIEVWIDDPPRPSGPALRCVLALILFLELECLNN